MKKFTILLTFLIFGFLAESHYNTNSTLQTEQCAVETGQFTISDSSVVIGAAYNSSVSVLVNSDQTIYSLSNQQWMWVEIIESDEINSEEYVLYITAVRNPFNFTRTGTIEVSNESGQRHTIQVMQRANTFNLLELSGEFLAIDASDDSIFTIDVMSNTHWNVSCSEDWLELTKNTGTGNQAVGIWAHENTLQTDRQALVTFTANNASTRVLRVRQWGESQTVLEVSTNELTLNYYLQDSSKIDIVSNTAWSIETDQSWLDVSPSSGEGCQSVYVRSVEGAPDNTRQGILTVTGNGATTQTIDVTQIAVDEYFISIPQTSFVVNTLGYGYFEIPVQSNTFWSAWGFDGNLQIIPEVGFGNDVIKVITQPNCDDVDYNALILIGQRDMEGEIEDIEIDVTIKGQSQAFIEPDAYNASIAAEAIRPIDFLTLSNTDWSVVSNDSWLSVDIQNHSGYNFFSVTATANTTSETRYGTLTISSPGLSSKSIMITQPGNGNVVPKLEIINPDFQLDASAGSSEIIEIASNIEWNISCDQSWLTLNTNSGRNNGFVGVVAAENTASTTRQATITVSGTGVNTETIIITQAAGTPSYTLSVSANSVNIAAPAGSTASVNLTSNTDWTATSNQTWLTVSPASGSNNGTLTFTAAENTASTTRQATITVSGTGVNTETIIITQAAGTPSYTLSVSANSVNIAAPAGSTASVNLTSNTDWTATSNQTWLTVSPASGSNNGTLTFTAAENTASITRQAIVTISAPGVNPVTVTVTQAAAAPTYILSVSTNSVNIAAPAGSTASINLTSNTDWTATSNQTWLTVSPASGSNNGTLTFTAAENTASTTRQATVTVSGTGVSTQTITVTQAAASVLVIDEGSTNITIGPESGTTITINIESNTSWTATSNQDWLQVSPASGTNNGTVTVSADPNPLSDDRQGVITITANGVSITIVVNQTGNVDKLVNVTFSVDMAYVDFDYDELFIAGSFNDWGDIIPMNANGDIWMATLQLAENETFEYKYLYTLDGEEYWDEVSGDCTTSDNQKNRVVDVPDHDLVLDVVYFGLCNHIALTALAGSDQEVDGDETVYLNGDYLGAFHSSEISYEWHVPEGIELNSNTIQNPTFTAPASSEDAYYVLLLYVSSGSITSAPDEITILVKKSTNTGVDQHSQAAIRSFPNPCNGVFEVSVETNDEPCRISVYNSVGARVYETKMNHPGNIFIDISHQQKGMYFVKVENSKISQTQKIMVK